MTVPSYAAAFEEGDAGGLIAEGSFKRLDSRSPRFAEGSPSTLHISFDSIFQVGRRGKVHPCPSGFLGRREQQSVSSPLRSKLEIHPLIRPFPSLNFAKSLKTVPNTYSAALSIQAIHPILEKIPRAVSLPFTRFFLRRHSVLFSMQAYENFTFDRSGLL